MIPVRFDEDARAALYRIMELRRDIRHFRPGDIDDDVLARILGAAELAPSVGFSQPWAFIVLRDPAIRARIRQSFLRCREAEATRFPADRRETYLEFKLEGIEESTLNVCVLADLRPRDEAILGTTVQPESVRASVCCAVQNLWLAARAEGIGIGWVSIVEPSVLREELALPRGVEPIAYLCVGHAEEFRERPLLEENGWRPRRASVIHRDRWPSSDPAVPAPSPSEVRGLPRPTFNAEGGLGKEREREGLSIPPFCEVAQRASLEHQLLLTKPHGSLGRLEEIAAWYAGAHGRFPPPRPERPLVAVFCADHGVTVEGVSAYPSSVTAGMVANIMAGGAAISVMAHRLDIHLSLVDVGVSGDLSAVPTNPLFALHRASVRAGTANFAREPAMTRAQAREAMDVGEQLAHRAASDDYQLLAVGEVGIGNTTSAAALLCAFTGASPSDAVGVGTGISDSTRLHKVSIVEAALRLHAPDAADPLGVLAAVGGLELAAMAGFLLAAARRRIPVVLDGFLATVSAVVAAAFDAGVTPYLLASHVSAEKGASLATAALGKTPLLDLGMRLGEGTGAVLAVDLVRTAVELQLSMATFATAGIRR
ncbi:nicotinate-nucleotide--dimethylbenzimidazole phosphoribosyltransferase [Pendulispora rubella]|uniref:Nicotinate-nucleotide--dimethylbenzimidazole phosphoribosyltransferase n=1 Tax=Pendulispora rubella TaxID=2741070 RepID=A0ABZ2L6K0_9BACT